MPKSRLEKLRIPMTWIYCTIVLVLIVFSRSTLGVGVQLALFAVGLALVSLASIGRLWCMAYISGYKTKKLIVEGPYSLCRNPLYFFSFLGILGLGLTTESFLYTGALVVPFFVLYPWVIRHEEAKLLAKHPDEYSAYFQTIPRFIPRISRFHEPDEYIVNPRKFRRHIGNALVFIWLVVFFELIEGFHELQWIPICFDVW